MTREVSVGNVKIGGGNKIAIQSMTTTDTKDIGQTVAQIHELENAGCDIVRCAAYDMECAQCFSFIKREVGIPVVADIHFDYRIAVEAIKNGADKIRINPGNIGGKQKILEVVKAAKDYNVPIRVGGNTGSLSEDTRKEFGNGSEALVQSALRNIEILKDTGFDDIVVSLKSSDVRTTVNAYRKMSKLYNYPLHLGVTEAGTYVDSAVKSSMGIGSLLMDGIGDTIRVSVTGNVLKEIEIARKILKYCGLMSEGVEIVSCPTCARCSYNVERMADCIAEYTKNCKKQLKIAIMGCVVNGPGEAKDADFGIAGGKEKAVLFEHGDIISHIDINDAESALKKLCDKYLK